MEIKFIKNRTDDPIKFNSLFKRNDSRDLKYYLDLVFQRAKAELRAEAHRGYMGMLWWVVEPIMYMSIFYLVFKHLRHRGDMNYITFLLTGLIVWKWFLATVLAGANSLIGNVYLMNQVYVPKIIFPLIPVFVNTLKFIIIFFLFLVFLWFFTDAFKWTWVFIPLMIALELILIVSVSSLLSALVPFLPDLSLILPNFMLMVFFLSGIFFEIAKLPPHAQVVLNLNPMALVITMFRAVLLEGSLPNLYEFVFVVLMSLLFLLLGGWLLFRYDRTYPKIIH